MEVSVAPGPKNWAPRGHSGYVAVGLILATGLLAGCGKSSWLLGSSKKNGGIEQLGPRRVSFLEEVAVPEGFRLVEGHSVDHESGGQRMAMHEYQGRADPFAVRSFYRQQMPQLGWDRVSDDSVKGTITLRFEKRREVCTVKIRSAEFGRCVINVEVSPFSRTSLEPPKQR